MKKEKYYFEVGILDLEMQPYNNWTRAPKGGHDALNFGDKSSVDESEIDAWVNFNIRQAIDNVKEFELPDEDVHAAAADMLNRQNFEVTVSYTSKTGWYGTTTIYSSPLGDFLNQESDKEIFTPRAYNSRRIIDDWMDEHAEPDEEER